MKEQAGFGLVPGAVAAGDGVAVSDEMFEGAAAVDAAGWVVPPQQRLSMPVQRLEPPSLRRLAGAQPRLQPASVATSAPAAADR